MKHGFWRLALRLAIAAASPSKVDDVVLGTILIQQGAKLLHNRFHGDKEYTKMRAKVAVNKLLDAGDETW